jgi:two-component system, response regulator PdtaR
MSRLRIILGDNDNSFLLSASNMLVQMGYDVIDTDTSGSGLLRKIRTLNPDVVIVDVSLKGMSGFEISDIVEGEGICPCIISYRGSHSEYMLKLQQKIIFAYIQKPANPMELNYAVENAYFNFKKFIDKDRKLKERQLIDRAKRLLIKKYGLTEDKAYEYIRKKSMDKCLSMHRIANAIIEAIENKKN